MSNHSTELLFEVYDSVAVGNDDKVLAVDASANAVDDASDKIVVVSGDDECARPVTVELVTSGDDPPQHVEASSSLAPVDVVDDASVDEIAKLHDVNITPNTDSNEPKPDPKPSPNDTTSITTTITEPVTATTPTTTMAPTIENETSESVVEVEDQGKNFSTDDIVESDTVPAVVDIVTNAKAAADDDKKRAVCE